MSSPVELQSMYSFSFACDNMVTLCCEENSSEIPLQYRGAFYKPKCQTHNQGDVLSEGLSHCAKLKARAPGLL